MDITMMVMMMNCNACGGQMVARKTTGERPYSYTASGLTNVYLIGITVFQCPRCKAEAPAIPRLPELHRAIREVLVRKPAALTGPELRFLRKNAGFPAAKFATLLGVSPEHLSRFENKKLEQLGRAADRLARAIVTVAWGGENVRDILLSYADHLDDTRRGKRARREFRLVNNRWRSAA